MRLQPLLSSPALPHSFSGESQRPTQLSDRAAVNSSAQGINQAVEQCHHRQLGAVPAPSLSLALTTWVFTVSTEMPRLVAIAATALAHDRQLATSNTADFDAIGLKLINPWEMNGQHP